MDEEKKENDVKVEEIDKKEVKAEKIEKAPKKEKAEKAKKASKTEKTAKSSKKALKVVVGILAVLAVVAIIVAVVLAFSSTPEKTVEGMLKNLKAGEFDKAGEMTTDAKTFSAEGEENQSLSEEAQKLFFDKLDWEMKETTVEGESATVALRLTNKNFQEVMDKYIKKVIEVAFSGQQVGEEEFSNYLIEVLKDETIPTATEESVINLVKQDGKWLVVSDEELMNSLLPKFEEAMNKLAQ